MGLRWYAGDGGNAAATLGADHAVLHAGPKRWVVRLSDGGKREHRKQERFAGCHGFDLNTARLRGEDGVQTNFSSVGPNLTASPMCGL